MANEHSALWRLFFQHFAEIQVPIRIKCIQNSVRFLWIYVDLREEIIQALKESTMDSEFTVRKEATSALALTYKMFPNKEDAAVDWILHGYHMNDLNDRLLIERLLVTSLVPFQLSPKDRMKKLYQLFGSIDEKSIEVFIQLHKNQSKIRKLHITRPLR